MKKTILLVFALCGASKSHAMARQLFLLTSVTLRHPFISLIEPIIKSQGFANPTILNLQHELERRTVSKEIQKSSEHRLNNLQNMTKIPGNATVAADLLLVADNVIAESPQNSLTAHEIQGRINAACINLRQLRETFGTPPSDVITETAAFTILREALVTKRSLDPATKALLKSQLLEKSLLYPEID